MKKRNEKKREETHKNKDVKESNQSKVDQSYRVSRYPRNKRGEY